MTFQQPFGRKIWVVIAACVAILSVGFGTSPEHLLLGWIYFPLRVLPHVTVDWPSVLIGGISVVAFAVGVHITVNWFQRVRAGAEAELIRWRWRSSIMLSLAVMLLFVAGVSMVGVSHQVVWLFSGRSTATDQQIEPVRGIVGSLQDSARQIQQSNNMKQIGLGMHNFADKYHDNFPPGGTMNEYGELLHGWAIFLGPYGSFGIAQELDSSVPWNQPPNDRVYKCGVRDVVNPALAGPYFDSEGYGLSHVAGNIHVLPIRQVPTAVPQEERIYSYGMMHLIETKQAVNLSSITDGTSHTVLVGTVVDRFKPWGHPVNLRDPASGINRSPEGFGGPRHWHGAMVTMCDGSVRMLSNKIDPRVLRALATPSGGERIDDDQSGVVAE